jgi:choline monooxygenase
MTSTLTEIIAQYDPNLALDYASTIPSSWYIDKDFYDHELKTVFSQSWQLAARADQLTEPGRYVTTDIAGEPVVIVRGNDGELRGFFNVCRHHAAAVMTAPEGKATQLRCPYHGWTYSLEGELKGTPDFSGVCDFDRASNGLVSLEIAEWENWVFVKLVQGAAMSLEDFLGEDLVVQTNPLQFKDLHWFERRHYHFDCNWKVFVDNYLDGG